MVLSKYWPIESCPKFSNQSHVVAQAGKIMGVRYSKCRSGVVLEQTYWNTQRRKCFVHWKKCQTANKEDSFGLTSSVWAKFFSERFKWSDCTFFFGAFLSIAVWYSNDCMVFSFSRYSFEWGWIDYFFYLEVYINESVVMHEKCKF